jgi:large subunit ribosomal protein L4
MEKISFFTLNGEEQEALQLAITRKAQVPNVINHGAVVRALSFNWRQGTVGCKSRSDVAFSNRKPWKQKGTGRARAGSLRSPLWRKGGVIFGPQKRTRKLFLNRKQGRLVLNDLLFTVIGRKALHQLDFELSSDMPSTKQAAQKLKGAGFSKEKIVLFLSMDDSLMSASFRNIPNVRIVYYGQPNAFALSYGSYWVVLKKDVDLFKGMVEKWN